MYKKMNHESLLLEQGWCSGEKAHLPPIWPGFDSGLVPYVG